ncbi:flagellar basal body P-ring formation chaperone FlgA [Roseomonas sp. AR75]|uniref:flagellar basal body P-ring formation chaperone FlgA n=1 Tax=Roseomonas sp. AR75 TaxID=2562311 RepID=UPI0010C0D195|nr:flagellar basal body P-ring formation chaperone FlgA [Roseomonas sp. AR75]
MRILLFAFLLLAPAAQAEQVAPRHFAVVSDAVVRLSDLFDHAGPRADTVLGPAPAPGARLVVEAAQLQAIARTNGLAWRSVGAERVVLERPGRALSREEVLVALRTALRSQGLDEEDEVELPGFSPPMVPEQAFVQLAVEGAVLDPAAGRFAATLAIVAEGIPTQRLRLAGRAVRMAPMLVAARRLPAGEAIRPGDVRVIRVPASRLRPGAAQAMETVVGQALRRPAAAEQPLLVSDLARPVAVERGQTVTMLYEIPGMTLTALGRAMDSAPRGGAVPVMNLSSRAVVQAEALGGGRVRVGGAR